MSSSTAKTEKSGIENAGLAIAVIAILGCVWYCWHFFNHNSAPPTQSERFYTDDEGKTFYKDTILRFPPFDHNGKTAVEAKVFTDGKNQFVGMLWRYKPETKKKLEEVYAQQGSIVVRYMLLSAVQYGGSEYKLVGVKSDWKSAAGMERGADYRAPDGSHPDPVQP